jgi:DUF4097 and DUF4098 domain-containing protein YvlB
MQFIGSRRGAVISLCALFLLTTTGCHVEICNGNWVQTVQAEKTVERHAPLASGSLLDVDTSSGSITIRGTDTSECHVVATITARAPSEEEAEALVEQVVIRQEQNARTLKIRADKPKLENNRSISISYAITAPRQINVNAHSSYGSLHVSDLEGTVNAKTSSGSIEAENIQGATRLDTSYGSIACRHIVGESITLHSSSGSVTASDIEGTAHMASSYGAVTCEQFSGGDLLLKSNSGRVAVVDATFGICEAHSSYGSVTGRQLTGDTVLLHSNSGSVEATEVTAPKGLDLSSSYGRVRATQIVTNDLKVHSGSGDIDAVCAEACEPELKADIETSYGSVDFAAPPGFAGRVRLVTHYGSVRSDLPITISGEITKKKIDGVVGDGRGDLRLVTSSGSVQLR